MLSFLMNIWNNRISIYVRYLLFLVMITLAVIIGTYVSQNINIFFVTIGCLIYSILHVIGLVTAEHKIRYNPLKRPFLYSTALMWYEWFLIGTMTFYIINYYFFF